MKKILLCGGHLTPAQALVENLVKEKDLEIYFFGRKFVTEGNKNLSAEFKQISNYNVVFKNIVAGRFQRHLSKYTLISLIKIPVGFIQSFFLLLFIRPKLIVSFGGSISFPVIFCGWLLGIESITHEQAVVPGLSNRLNGLFVKKIYGSWKESLNYYPKEKTVVIGNLVRGSLLKGTAKKLRLPKKHTIFITGGNQGSHFLNTFVFENIKKLSSFNIIHQVGTANFKGDHDKAKSIKQNGYLWYDYIKPETLKSIFDAAQIIISRAGANTVWELALLGKVAILVPLLHSAGSEQAKNASILQSAGSAIVIGQKEANSGKILESIEKIQADYGKMLKSAENLAKTLPHGADKILASDIKKIIST
jgi:UDP-N-acetylglucosamine--N-acetylmuramyl-(pentapeptide) pyrophosphoryl-undecaprenol N-acetylglucosamine transferase